MTEKQAGTPMFPLKPGSGRLGLMSMEARAALCSLLPVESAEKTHPLWQLDKVQNRDKHRTLQVAAAAAALNDFSVNHGRIGSLKVSGGELGAMPLALVEWSPDTAFHGSVNHVMGFAFGAGSSEVAGQSVVGTLDSWHDHIRQTVFPELEPFLTTARRG
jgi:hypothetical protein